MGRTLPWCLLLILAPYHSISDVLYIRLTDLTGQRQFIFCSVMYCIVFFISVTARWWTQLKLPICIQYSRCLYCIYSLFLGCVRKSSTSVSLTRGIWETIQPTKFDVWSYLFPTYISTSGSYLFSPPCCCSSSWRIGFCWWNTITVVITANIWQCSW